VGKEEGTAEALRTVAVGVGELVDGVHAQAFGTQRYAISSPLAVGIAMRVEGNGCDAASMRVASVNICPCSLNRQHLLLFENGEKREAWTCER